MYILLFSLCFQFLEKVKYHGPRLSPHKIYKDQALSKCSSKLYHYIYKGREPGGRGLASETNIWCTIISYSVRIISTVLQLPNNFQGMSVCGKCATFSFLLFNKIITSPWTHPFKHWWLVKCDRGTWFPKMQRFLTAWHIRSPLIYTCAFFRYMNPQLIFKWEPWNILSPEWLCIVHIPFCTAAGSTTANR